MIHERLLDDTQATLTRHIRSDLRDDPLDRVFTAWLTPDVDVSISVSKVTDEITAITNRSYRQTAALGIVAQTVPLQNDVRSKLTSDLKHLFGREPVVAGTPMPFCMDGLALAGIMLATHSVRSDSLLETASKWLALCCDVTSQGTGIEEWQEWLLRLIGSHTSLAWDGHRCQDAIAAVVSVALRSKGIAEFRDGETEQAHEELALEAIQSPSAGSLSLGHAILRLAALNWIRRIRPVADLRTASLDDLAQVLRRFPDGLKCWVWEAKPRTKKSVEPRKWHVDNEYHVQSILWLVLAPLFPDLVPEDSTPKIGPLQPRADIGIPSLRAIVEAKFMRSKDSPKDMIEQIAQDASLYLVPDSRYDKLIPFIWDDSRRSEHHEDVLRGLRQIRGVADAIIISRPGIMGNGQ